MELRQQLYIRSWLENFNWKLELELHNEFGVQFGADSSIVLEKETVFVIWPDRWSRTTSETYTLWGQIEIVDDFREWLGVKIFGKMAHGEREFAPCHVISTSRGPAFQAVRCLQRAFRRRRCFQLYRESGGWDAFVQVVVAFAECRGRRGIMRLIRKVESVSWGYVPVPAPAVAEWPGICVPALDMAVRQGFHDSAGPAILGSVGRELSELRQWPHDNYAGPAILGSAGRALREWPS